MNQAISVLRGGVQGPTRRQPPILAAYEHFRLDRQGMLVSPRTLEYYDGMVLPFLRWVEADGVQRFEALEVSRLRVYRAQLATRPGRRHGSASPAKCRPRLRWIPASRSASRYISRVKATEVAPVETLLGRLQRGRGSGYIEALADHAAATREAVLECVVRDPRWDAQVEARSTYYANLMVAVDLELDPVEAHLFADEDHADRDEHRTGLAIHVLGDLARRGRRGAVPLLRRYVATGWNWIWALHELVALDLPGADDGLSDAIAARFVDDTELLTAMRSVDVASARWVSSNPRVRRALDTIAADQAKLKRTGFPPMESMTAALSGSEADRHTALVNLGTFRSPLVVEAAETAIRTGPAELRRVARRALFRSGEAAGMVERARSWATENNELSEVALHVLARHGTASDIPFLREQLARARAQGNMYAACDAVEGVGRLADVR